MDAKDENLRELVEKLIKAQNAKRFLEDIEAGEQILREYPAPLPDDMVLANIKANMALHRLPQRTVSFRKRVFEALAVAASIAIIAIISFRSLSDTPNSPPDSEVAKTGILPEGWWAHEDEAYVNIIDNYKNINTQYAQMEADNYNNDDLALNEFQNQIEKVQDRLVSIESGANTPMESYINPSGTLEEIQNQLNELRSNFWQDDYSNSAFNE
jgi:hypothetical protein